MRKWIILLTLALLLSTCARAEEAEYYTNKTDIYYHSNPDCDRPPEVDEYGIERNYYDRECYRKYPISATAAEAFEKKPCPVCVKEFEPVYLGEYPPMVEDVEAWRIARGAVDATATPYKSECEQTYERFRTYYEEIYNPATDSITQKNTYPAAYAGMWFNCTGGYSYAVVDPTQEIMDSFVKLFGSGAWIVPAKYGYNEMRALQDRIFELVEDWRTRHPEFDLEVDSAALAEWGNSLDVIMYGESYDEAMPVLDQELDLPVWVRFSRTTERVTEF